MNTKTNAKTKTKTKTKTKMVECICGLPRHVHPRVPPGERTVLYTSAKSVIDAKQKRVNFLRALLYA
jgi:hypothetical protein